MLNREYSQHRRPQHALPILITQINHYIPQEVIKETASHKLCLIWQNIQKSIKICQNPRDSLLLMKKENILRVKQTWRQQIQKLLWLNNFLKRSITTISLGSKLKALSIKPLSQIMNKTKRWCKHNTKTQWMAILKAAALSQLIEQVLTYQDLGISLTQYMVTLKHKKQREKCLHRT